METDSWLSADGVLVIHHDIDLCRTTDIEDFGYDCIVPGNNPLGRFPRPRDLTLAELKQLDAGSWFDPAFAGERIPTVGEALQLVDGSGYPLLIEIKTTGQGAKFAQIVQQLAIDPSALVIWDRQRIASSEFRTALPGVRRIVGGFAAADLTDVTLADLANHGDFGVGVITNTGLTEEIVDRVHSHGLIVYGYPGAMNSMPLFQQIEIGVDIIHYTDPQWWADTLPLLQCVDGIDNDGDGAIDYPSDSSCFIRTGSSESAPQTDCENGLDDDGDGLADFPQDPGCTLPSDVDERIVSLVCDNGIDDDGDGLIDFPEDDGCLDPLGPTEVGAPEPTVATMLVCGVLAIVAIDHRRSARC